MSGYSMKCGVVLGGLACALVATAPVARADDAKLEAFNKQISDVMSNTSEFEDLEWSGGRRGDFSEAYLTACSDAVAAGKSAGLTGSSKVYGMYGRADAHKDDKGDPYLTLDEVQSFCKVYEHLVIQELAEVGVLSAFLTKRDSMGKIKEGMYPSEAEWVIKDGETCNTRVDAALAAKFPASHVLSAPRSKMEGVKLGDAKAEYCQPVLDWGKQRLADINGAADAKVAEIAKVYAAVGIKGDRFKLFSSIGLPDNSGFLAPGCEKYVDTAKGLAKAKKLFTWFEAEDGSILVTKYTFKGNKYKETEKRYATSARAYKGCK